MRVALVDPSLFTLPYDAALARGLQDAGCDVTLHGRKRLDADGGADGIKLAAHFYPVAETRFVRRLPKSLRLAVKGADHLFSMRRLWRRLQAARPDVIHFQWLALPLLDGRLLSRFRRLAPLVLTVHDTNPFNGNPAAGLQRLGVQRALAGFDRLIVHTSQGRARLVEQGARAERMAVVPHGSLSGAGAVSEDALQGQVTFLLFGKIKPYKGADVLMDAFAGLPPHLRHQASLRIVGKPYMNLDELRAQADSLGISAQVSIEPDFISDSAIDALFGPGTIAVFPYREIEASGVLSYAIANGRPIVASAIGSFAELLRDGVHGRLVPPADAPALRRAMSDMLQDRAHAAACARAVADLSGTLPQWDDIARSTLRVYREAAEAHA
jgi:glycosyltransferase involved in cell wall biosynthesis